MELENILRRGRRLRTLGIDDSPFQRGSRGDVLVCGAVYSGDEFEGLLTTRVRQDGWNATARLISMVAGSKFHAQLHLVMLDGITLGGFNMVDLPRLAGETGLPCVAVTRKQPDRDAILRALENLTRPERRRRIMERAGPVRRAGKLWFQACGVAEQTARRAIQACATRGHMPQCIRAAHLIGSGVVTGESGKRA